MDVKGLFIGVGTIAAGGAMAIAVPIVDSRSLAERNAWGQPYTAEVVKRKSTSSRSGSSSTSTTTRTYRINYTYVLDGKRYCHHKVFEHADPPEACADRAPAKVNKPTYEAHWTGDPIEIRIDPDDPADSRPVILPDHGKWRTWGGFLALCGALVIWASVRGNRESEQPSAS